MRLGVFGGTFDPPHVGHLLAASDAYEALSLTRLLFVPAAQQPFKVGAVHASAEQRVRMLELTVGDDARFAVDRIEVERAGLSYTVETLTALRQRAPEAELDLLIGEDLAGEIERWREARRIPALARIVILARSTDKPVHGALPMHRIRTRRVEVSGTEIRARVRTGHSIRGFVTDGVAAYIRAAGLYR